MRVVGLIGLVLALVVVGVLVKRQLGGVAASPLPPGAAASAPAAAGDVRAQAQQIQQQFRQSLDAAQQRRPMPDDN
jgi:hypothetical protein